jgi:uncharacterized protein
MPLPYLRLAREAAVLQGEVPLSDFPRLLPELLFKPPTVPVLHYRLHWYFWPASALAAAEGQLTTILPLTCQRCLMPLSWPVVYDFQWVFINHPEEADALPDNVEAIDPKEAMQTLSLRYLLEDSLLLALPLFPSHPPADCAAAGALPKVRPQPFAVLAELNVRKKDPP